MKLHVVRPVPKRHLLTDVTWEDVTRLEKAIDIKNSNYQWHRSHITTPPITFNNAAKLATVFAAIDYGMGVREIAKYLNVYPSTLGPYIDKFYVTYPTGD